MYVCAVNMNYWGDNFETAILFCDFFLGSNSDVLGSFGTFLAHIGGLFLNELKNHFTSNLLLSFVFLQSIWCTREEILNFLSFCLTFFWFKEQQVWPFWHIYGRYWRFFSEWVAKSIREQFIVLLNVSTVNLAYTRGILEFTILSCSVSWPQKDEGGE